MLDRVKQLFVHNIGLKLLSLVLAGMSWWIIQGVIGFEVQYNVPVRVDVSDGIAVMSQSHETVAVTFRGSQEDIRSLDDSTLNARVDLTDAVLDQRTHSVMVRNKDISGSRGVKIVSVRPDRLGVTLDQQVEKQVLVRPRLVNIPEGGSVRVEPEHVLLSGPKASVENRREIATIELDLEGVTESVTKLVELEPPEGWISTLTPSYVSSHVTVSQKSSIRELEALPVELIVEPGRQADIVIAPTTVSVTLHGGDAILKKIGGDDIQVFVDCRGTEPGKSYERKVMVHLGQIDGVQTTVEPSAVRVTVKDVPLAEPKEPEEDRPENEESLLLEGE